jgi:hypothetical protein
VCTRASNFKAAVERARQLREERKNGTLTENDTFQPQVNPRRPLSNHNNSKPADSLDKLATDFSNDIMEQPLPAQRNRQAQQQISGPLSPGSDALGKEVKRHGSQYESANKRQADAQYKSKFLQQYEDSHSHLHNGNQNHPNASIPSGVARSQHQQPQPNPDDEFSNHLRADSGRKSSGPGWNSDTSGGFDAPPPRTKKPSRPTVQQATQARYQQQDEYGGEPLRPPRASPRASSGGDMMSQYNNASNGTQGNDVVVSQARPKLSLLKSKIRLSQGANNLPPPEPVAPVPANRRQQSYNYQDQEPELQSHSTTVDVPPPRRQPQRTQPQQQYQNDSRGRRNSYGYNDDQDQGDQEIMIAVPKNRTILKKTNSGNYGNFDNNAYNPSFQSQPQRQGRQQQQQQGQYNQYDEENDYGQRNQLTQQNKPRFNPSYDEPPQAQQQSQPRSKFNPSYDDTPPQQPVKPKFKPTYDEPPAQTKPKFNPSYDDPPQPNSHYQDDGGQEEEEDYGPIDESLPQHECPDCGRKFNEIAFSKHVKICRKVFVQKRKAFDSTKMRIGDNQELVKIFTKAQKEEKKQQMLAQKQANKRQDEQAVGGGDKASKWKEQSKAFREAMKAAREYSKAKESGAPLPPPPVASAPDPSLIPCPHCGRRFNDKAAERHIPQCQNIKAKPSILKRGGGVNSATGTAIVQKKDARKK